MGCPGNDLALVTFEGTPMFFGEAEQAHTGKEDLSIQYGGGVMNELLLWMGGIIKYGYYLWNEDTPLAQRTTVLLSCPKEPDSAVAALAKAVPTFPNCNWIIPDVMVQGYPGEKEGTDSGTQWTMTGTANCKAEILTYKIKTSKGQSGSPVLLNPQEVNQNATQVPPLVIGIHVGRQEACCITKQKRDRKRYENL